MAGYSPRGRTELDRTEHACKPGHNRGRTVVCSGRWGRTIDVTADNTSRRAVTGGREPGMNHLTPSHPCFKLGAHLWESAVHEVTYLKWYMEAVELGLEQISLTTKLCLFFSYSTLGKELENIGVRHVKALQPHSPSGLRVMLSDAGPAALVPRASSCLNGQDSLPGLLTSYKVGKHQRLSLTGPGGERHQNPVPSSHSSPQVSPFSTGQPGVTPRNCQSRHRLHHVENQPQGPMWSPRLASAGVWDGITRTLPLSRSAPAARSLNRGGPRLPWALVDLIPQPGDRFLTPDIPRACPPPPSLFI